MIFHHFSALIRYEEEERRKFEVDDDERRRTLFSIYVERRRPRLPVKRKETKMIDRMNKKERKTTTTY